MKTTIAILLLATATTVRADIVPASPFTDHMVLQRGAATAVFGSADPGETVTVTLNGQTQSTQAKPDGRWRINLADLKAGGPYTLSMAGKNKVDLQDVFVGEVWLCSGQSNMDFTVVNTPKYRFAGVQNMEEEVRNANYPTIRMFSGEWQRAYTPQPTVKGVWKPVTPENVKEMSAIGYFFARDLQKELNVPIGIVTETFGASCAEAWISREALAKVPTFDGWLKDFDQKYADYKEKAATQPAATSPTTRRSKDPSQDQHMPTVMYNGMISPILPYTFRGVLWYQGESILKGHLESYPLTMETLIADWRGRFENPELPFYFVQLAALNNASNKPEVREAQAAALKVPHTGMAVTIDIGDRKNVHPKNKQDVGDRLCRIALANTYGKPVEYSGPMFDSMSVEGSAVRLKFTHAEGLVAKTDEVAFSPTGELHEFTIAGADGKFVPATAKINGNMVIVSSPEVPAPTQVRYAWSNYPEHPDLYNAAHLPAAPFRTDK